MQTSLPSRAPIDIGARAPDFELHDADGRTYRLDDFRGSPVVLAFDPGHWDPARAEHVERYNRLIERAPGLAGARLLSISGDGPWRELAFDDAARLAIPVLSGDDGATARRYGVADGAPAVFVLDGEGTVRWRHVPTDAGGAPLPHPDDLARALAALAGPPEPSEPNDDAATSGWTRREFVATALAAAVALALTPLGARAESSASVAAPPPPRPLPAGTDAAPVTLRVNGRDLTLTLEPRVTLLDALREYAGLTGSKKGCDHGQCGACTVHVDGRRVLSCLTFAVMQQGKAITTIEGLAAGSEPLHPMQRAFIANDGFQCGYCTPGQIMSACAMVKEPWGPSDDDVREAMSGNICRCGAYPGIVAAIQEVRRAGPATSDGGSPR